MNIGFKSPIVKKVKELKKKRKKGLVVLEGLSILEFALNNNVQFETVLYVEETLKEDAEKIKKELIKKATKSYTISQKVFESISEKDNYIGIIAIAKYAELSTNIDLKKYHFILVNDGIELPGNLGTIYRSAYATSVDLIINVDLKTSIYNPKFITSSRGVMFSIPTINTTYEEAQKILLQNNFRILLGEPVIGSNFHGYNYQNDIAIVIGNERFGINPKWYQNKHESIYIPMNGELNSINVGAAASIIMYEAAINRNNFKK